MSLFEFMGALVPNAGTLRDALTAARARLDDDEAIRALAAVDPVALKPWAREFARRQIDAAAGVLPHYTDAAHERAVLIDLLAELDARRRGVWND